jgi:signal transduction histidine kinase
LVEVQETERRKFARDLHDDLGQRMTALKMELAAIDPGQDSANINRLNRAGELAAGILESIRDISSMLRPTILDDLGLKAALDWHVQKFSQRTDIPCTLLCSLQEPDDFPDLVRTCIYRVVQEALNNCEKHASATSIHIRVDRSDSLNMTGDVIVTIADNGRGFRPGAVTPDGSGLSGMKERVALLGGTFTIESSEGDGTAIVFTIPASRLKS